MSREAISKRMLPEGWREVQLGDVCSVNEETLSSKTSGNYHFEYISLSDVEHGQIIQTHKYKFSEAPSRARRIVKQGDVLLATVRPHLQGFCVLKDQVEDRIASTGFAVLRVKPKLLHSSFLLYFLLSNKMLGFYYAMNIGSSYPAINSSDIPKFKIILPSLLEQRAIARLLETWDTAIDKTEKLISEKEKQFGWLATRLFNEQNEHLIKLGDCFGKSVLVEKGQPLIKAQTSNSGRIPVIAGGKKSPYNHESATHAMPCITVSSSGAYAGYVWYHDYPIWASDCNVIHSTKHSTKYLYFVLKSKQSKIYALQSGGGQPHVYAQDLKNIIIPLPPIEEQSKIASILDIEEQEISLLKDLAQQYRVQKRGLMQKLLTGKWRI